MQLDKMSVEHGTEATKMGSLAPVPEAVQRLLSELHLECFEMAFQQRELRSIKDLALIRFEELLELGLSMVQCHLFLAKISEILPPENGTLRVQEIKGTVEEEILRAFMQEGTSLEPSRDDHGESGDFRPETMPPPPSTPLSEVCRKRAHSSHYSTGAARGSERPTSSVSATDSSSSLHLEDIRVRKRRRRYRDDTAESHTERRRSSRLQSPFEDSEEQWNSVTEDF